MSTILEEIIKKATAAKCERVSRDDLKAWGGNTGDAAFWNEIALKLARKYHAGKLGYTSSDSIMSDLWFAWVHDPDRGAIAVPEPFYSIYLAFDSGEYFRRGERDIDPVEKYTNPQIAEIVQAHSVSEFETTHSRGAWDKSSDK